MPSPRSNREFSLFGNMVEEEERVENEEQENEATFGFTILN